MRGSIAVAGAMAFGLLVGACGDESTPGAGGDETVPTTTGSGADPGEETGASATTPATPPASEEDRRCNTPELTIELEPQGVAAGNHYATVILKNVSGQTCTIFGYGGVELVDAGGQPVPTEQSRNEQHPPTLVTLQPGEKASSLLHWGAVPTGDEPTTGPCQPEPAFLRVIPPDETTQLTATWPGGPVCRQGLIDQWAYAKGVVEPG